MMNIQNCRKIKENKLYIKIENLKEELNDMLFQKNYVIDSEVVKLSKEIDEILNMYLKNIIKDPVKKDSGIIEGMSKKDKL